MKWFSPDTDPALFKCPCGQCDQEPTDRLLNMLDAVRDDAAVPMKVTSGPRCWHYNTIIGGAEYSGHVDGEAADIAVTTSRARSRILEAARRYGVTRIGIAKGFVHLGVSRKHDQHVTWVYD